jgi:hypothetical protein
VLGDWQSPPKRVHLAVQQCDQAMLGDGDAVAIGAGILREVLRPAEGGLESTSQFLRKSGCSQAAKNLVE